MKTKDLETKRCVLKEITIDDAEQIVEWRSNPDIYRYFKNPIKIDVESHIKWFNDSYLHNKNRIDYILFLKSPKIKIGVFGINRLQNDLVEISYLLDEQYQGKGYASEAINGLEKFCYEQWGTNVFVAEIHTENAKSISFITKMGYKKTRTCGCFEFFEKRI